MESTETPLYIWCFATAAPECPSFVISDKYWHHEHVLYSYYDGPQPCLQTYKENLLELYVKYIYCR